MEVLTNKQYDSYKNAKICNLCEEKFEDSKVRDHCNYTGEYRGTVRNI